MNTKQAKDFLADQAAQQAVLDRIPLSEIEKRMMYFTESDPSSCDDPVALNDEFEAEYEMPEYEAKMSKLLHRAYKRLKSESPEQKRNWDEAIRVLRRDDHYFLVLWDIKPASEHRLRDSFALLGTGILVATGLVIVFFGAAEHKVSEEHFRKYLLIAVISVLFVGTGTLKTIYRIGVVWYHRRKVEDGDSE
jgi:hypothetical protein